MLLVVMVITDCDETLTIRSNKSDGYASIVASELRVELFGRIGTLERDNMRLGGMLGVERHRVDRLRRSMSALILALLDEIENFVVYYNASHNGLGSDAEGEANVAPDALSRKERAKPLRVGALVMTINSNLPPQIHEVQVEALKKKDVKDENLHVVSMARHGSRHRHLYQQVLDVFNDEGRLSEAIRFTNTTRNNPLEMGKYSHGYKSTKDNKQLRHNLGNCDHQKNYADVRCKPLEFQVGDKVMLKVSPWKGVIHFGKRGKLNPRLGGIPGKVLNSPRNAKISFEGNTLTYFPTTRNPIAYTELLDEALLTVKDCDNRSKNVHPKNDIANKVPAQKVTAKRLHPIRDFILGLAAIHIGLYSNKTFGIRKCTNGLGVIADNGSKGKRKFGITGGRLPEKFKKPK
ncbi:hypothetical protein Tco_1509103 [Tanacetum coccineum]